MPHFIRTQPAPAIATNYSKYKPLVRSDFKQQCGYCLLDELFAGGEENFELDHFRPSSLFPEDKLNFYNIYYSCHPCNHIKRAKWPPAKSGLSFVDLCESKFSDHFMEHEDGRWEGLTKVASYTIDALRLNRTHLCKIRALVKKLKSTTG